MGPRDSDRKKRFFQKRRNRRPQPHLKFAATPQRRPVGLAVHGLGRCGPFATVDATHAQRQIFRVSLRRGGSGQNFTPRRSP